MIIITGATGFIGTYLVDRLINDGVEVLATDRSEMGEAYCKKLGIPFMRLDITKEKDFDRLPTQNVDTVVHLAALLTANVKNYDPRKYIEINTIGTLNVLEYCRKNNIKKIISFGTHTELEGFWGSSNPIDESERKFKFTGDHAVYVISKIAASNCIEHYAQEYGIHGVFLRLPAVFGYGGFLQYYKDGKWMDSGFKLFIDAAVNGSPIELWGNPKNIKDYIYVKDVVFAIIKAIESNKSKGVYNISSGRGITLKEEIEGIVKIFSPKDKYSKIIHCPEKIGIQKSYIYDICKAKKDFGFIPKYSFENMLVDIKKEMESKRFKHLIIKKTRAT